jgi:archaellum component FlaC
MNEKNPKVKLVLLFFIITSLCVPGSVLAADNGSFIDSILTKARMFYEDTLGKASNYKNEKISNIQSGINNYQAKLSNKYTGISSSLSGIKNSLPGISSTLSGIKTGISLSGIKNSIPKSSSLGIKNNALAVAGTLKSKALAGLKSGIPSIAITGLKSGVPTIALTGIPGVSNTLSGIKSSLSGIKSDLSGIKSDLSGIKNDLAKRISGLSSIKNSTLGIASTLKSKALADLKSGIPSTAIAGLKNGVPTIALTGIPGVSNTLSGIKSSLSGIKSDLSGIKNDLAKRISGLSSIKNSTLGIASTLKSKALADLKSGIPSTAIAGLKNGVPTIALTGIPGVSNTLSGIKSSLSGIESDLSGIKNDLAKGISGLSSIKNNALAVAGTLKSKALAGLKSGIPTISLTGAGGSGIMGYLSKGNLPGTVLTSGITKDLSSIKIFNSETFQPSQLWVLEGNPQDVVSMLNNVSFQQYYATEDGQIFPDPDAAVKVKKSREHSSLVNSLIKADKPTGIFYNASMPSTDSYMQELDAGCIVALGGIPGVSGVDPHHPDYVLPHELAHSLRVQYNLTKAPYEGLGILDEEGSVISLENLFRYQTDYPMRSDGPTTDDIDKNGFPDGDGSYGQYYYSDQNWFSDFLNNTKN